MGSKPKNAGSTSQRITLIRPDWTETKPNFGPGNQNLDCEHSFASKSMKHSTNRKDRRTKLFVWKAGKVSFGGVSNNIVSFNDNTHSTKCVFLISRTYRTDLRCCLINYILNVVGGETNVPHSPSKIVPTWSSRRIYFCAIHRRDISKGHFWHVFGGTTTCPEVRN